jgi:hypothetical protein
MEVGEDVLSRESKIHVAQGYVLAVVRKVGHDALLRFRAYIIESPEVAAVQMFQWVAGP